MRVAAYDQEIQLNKRNIILHTLLPILIFLTIIQQMPIVRDNYYSEIRAVLYLLFGLLSFVSIFNLPKLLKYKMIRYHFICVLYVVLMYLVSRLLGLEINMGIIFEPLIPFGILLCSSNIEYNKESLLKIINVYIIMTTVLGISLIYYYGSGFVILGSYFFPGKNSIGPLLGTAIVILIYRILFPSEITIKRRLTKNNNLIKIILMCMLVSSIIVLRNRSGLVALIIVILVMIFNKIRTNFTMKNIIIFQILALVFVILNLTGLLEKLMEPLLLSLTLNHDVSDINSISSGRVSVYLDSLSYSLKYPLLGELNAVNKFYTTPHNYMLNKWVSYGIIGSFPLMIFYLYLWRSAIFQVLRSKRYHSINTVGYWILLFSLIVSLFEYTYPFGPGVSQIMLWFLLGQNLRSNK